MMRYCRDCGDELVPGVNWARSFQAIGDYICKSCRSAYDKTYYMQHKERVLATNARWAKAHPENMKACDKRYREAHPKRQTVRQRRWRKANPQKAKAKACRAASRRRARLAGALLGHIDRQAIFKADGYRCVYCGSVKNLTLDHIVPLAKGGADIQENMVTACRHCNASKGAKVLVVWLAARCARRERCYV